MGDSFTVSLHRAVWGRLKCYFSGAALVPPYPRHGVFIALNGLGVYVLLAGVASAQLISLRDIPR